MLLRTRFRFIAQFGFDQYGSLFGQIVIDNDVSKDVIELNLSGIRFCRELSRSSTSNVFSIIGVFKDGLVFSIHCRNSNKQQNM